jgi:hypothetical protein
MVENVQRIETWERLKFDARSSRNSLRRSFQFAFSTLLAVGSRGRSPQASSVAFTAQKSGKFFTGFGIGGLFDDDPMFLVVTKILDVIKLSHA